MNVIVVIQCRGAGAQNSFYRSVAPSAACYLLLQCVFLLRQFELKPNSMKHLQKHLGSGFVPFLASFFSALICLHMFSPLMAHCVTQGSLCDSVKSWTSERNALLINYHLTIIPKCKVIVILNVKRLHSLEKSDTFCAFLRSLGIK